jgi:hypothetical protein
MRSVVVSMCVFLGTLRVAQPRNLAFLTTFCWSSGSRNARGEMAHSDALTSACLLSLKGSVASFGLCADDFRSRDLCTTAISRSFDHLVCTSKLWRGP